MQGIATPIVLINNLPISIVPNSFKFTEGFGEQGMFAASTGAGRTVPVSYDNAEGKLGQVTMEVYATIEYIELFRVIKDNFDQNTIQVVDPKSGFVRVFRNALLITNYEVELTNEGKLSSLEFKTAQAI